MADYRSFDGLVIPSEGRIGWFDKSKVPRPFRMPIPKWCFALIPVAFPRVR